MLLKPLKKIKIYESILTDYPKQNLFSAIYNFIKIILKIYKKNII